MRLSPRLKTSLNPFGDYLGLPNRAMLLLVRARRMGT